MNPGIPSAEWADWGRGPSSGSGPSPGPIAGDGAHRRGRGPSPSPATRGHPAGRVPVRGGESRNRIWDRQVAGEPGSEAGKRQPSGENHLSAGATQVPLRIENGDWQWVENRFFAEGGNTKMPLP